MTRTASRPAGRPPKYAERTITQALDLYREHGLAEAHRQTRIPKPTITRWAKARGIDSAEVTKRNAANAAAATEAAAIARRQLVDEAREQLVVATARIALEAAAAELAILQASRAAVDQAGTSGAVSSETMAVLRAVESGPGLRAIVGSRTRAVHDLELLDGRETERGPAGPITLVFATGPLATSVAGAVGPPVHDIVDVEYVEGP